MEHVLCIRSTILKSDQNRMGPTVVGCVTHISICPRNPTILVPCGNRRSLASELSPALPLQKLYMQPDVAAGRRSYCVPSMMPEGNKVDVLIIGAGPAGLMCANALLWAEMKVKIIDKQ